MESNHAGTEQWAIYEGNVQAYRGLAISAQSLFLAVGAILLEDLELPFTAAMAFALVATWWIFFPVIFARTAIVDFHKFDLGSRFDRDGRPASSGTGEGLREDEYGRVLNLSLRRRVYEHVTADRRARLGSDAEPFRTMRQTRRKLDVFLPAIFTAVWVIFAVYVALG